MAHTSLASRCLQVHPRYDSTVSLDNINACQLQLNNFELKMSARPLAARA
jgi:hypothetical protein